MIVKLLTESHLESLSLKGGCRDSSESTLVKMSNCWKSQTAAQFTKIQSYTSRVQKLSFCNIYDFGYPPIA